MKQSSLLIFSLVVISIFALTSNAGAQVMPQRQGHQYVNDFAHILTQEQQSKLEAKLQNEVKARGNEIAVLIMDHTGLSNLQPFGDSILNQWGIGKMYNGRGVLILVDMTTKKVYMAVGAGLREPLTTEARVMLLSHYVFPAFRQQKYYEGLDQCITGLSVMLIPPDQMKDTLDNNDVNIYNRHRAAWIIALMVIAAIAIYFVTKKKNPAKK